MLNLYLGRGLNLGLILGYLGLGLGLIFYLKLNLGVSLILIQDLGDNNEAQKIKTL